MKNITEAPKEVVIRNVRVKLGDSDYGLVKDVVLNIEKVIGGRDTKGRPVVNGYMVRADWEMMQVSDSVLLSVFDAIINDGEQTLYLIYRNGINGMEITEVIPSYDFTIDGSGKPSKIKCHVERAIKKDMLPNIFAAMLIPEFSGSIQLNGVVNE